MIKIQNDKVFNLEGAIRGMRDPLNSWDKSDSHYTCAHSGFPCEKCIDYNGCKRQPSYYIGENDLKLAKSLAKAGSDHRKFMRQIFVSVDIKAPLYWWKEFDTYKVGTTANSCSTMHTIHTKEFTIDDFSHEHLLTSWEDGDLVDFNSGEYFSTARDVLEWVIYALNLYRSRYLETKDKKYWWQMIQLLPSSYNQLRTVTMNYENLVNMYHARKAHKLDEWRDFCKWIETLPYSELITGGKDDAVEE